MKRLTLALWSMMVMLFLGIGTAWAQQGGDGTTVPTVPTPAFAEGQDEVRQGETINITWTGELTEFMDMAFVLYVENDETTELSYNGTMQELMALAIGGGGGTEPAVAESGDGTGEATAPAFKVAFYSPDQATSEDGWAKPVTLSSVGDAVKVRARLAVGTAYDGLLQYSSEITKTFKVTERQKPAAPQFVINDVEVASGARVEYAAGTGISVKWTGYPAEDNMHIVVYTLDGNETVFEATSMMNIDETHGNMWYFMDDALPVTDLPKTIKAAVAEITDAATYAIMWSDIVTVEILEAKAVPMPTFSSEGVVWKGQKVEITCATEGAKIYYTLDGTEPSTAGTEYTAPVAITADMTLKAIAVSGEGEAAVTSNIAIATYTVKTPAAPVLTPATGATVEQGGSIEFTLPDDCATEKNVFFVYVFGNNDLQLEQLTTEQLTGIMQGQTPEGFDGVKVSKPSRGTGKVQPATVPLNATGNIAFQARMAVGVKDPENTTAKPLVYSDKVTATYTVSAATPAPKPTFNIKAGEVEYNTGLALLIDATDEEMDKDIYAIYYVLDKPDFDFSQYTTVDAIVEAGAEVGAVNQKSSELELNISTTLTKSTTVRAAACKRIETAEGFGLYAWSEVAEAAYTVMVAEPTFSSEAGAVWKGQKVAIDCTTKGAKIYYTTNGDAPAVSSTEYTAPVAITANMTLKAIAVVGEGEAAITSAVAEAAYTVKTPATPVLTPATGATVEQGANIAFTLPDDFQMDEFVYHVYVFNDTRKIEDLTYAQLESILYGEATDDLSDVQIAGIGMDWLTWELKAQPAIIPVDATGETKMRTRMVVGINPEEVGENITMTLLYSDETSATYTVTKATPAPKPTFSVEAGEVENNTGLALLLDLTDEEYESNGYAIYYVADKPDFDFSQYTTEAALEAAGAKIAQLNQASSEYEPGNFTTLTKNTTFRAAACKRVTNLDYSYTFYAWSEVAEAAYTIKGEEPEKLEKPTFSAPAGKVAKGTNLTWTFNEDYLNLYDQVGVIYVAEGEDADLEMTATEILQAYEDTPTDDTREDGTVYVYEDGDEVGYKINKDVTVKARLFGITLDPNYDPEADENGEPGAEDMIAVFSDIVTVSYTVEGEIVEPEIATPVITPGSGEVEKGTKVTITCATEGAYIVYTLDGSKPSMASDVYKEDKPIIINEALTLKAAAVVQGEWSEVAEATYTIKTANEELELAGVSVYPNPSDGEFTLDLPVAATVEVFASTGMMVQRIETGAGLVTLNIERSGIYFLRITGEGRTTVKRVIVR